MRAFRALYNFAAERRMEAAGAQEVKLVPGKRGRYSLSYYSVTGWGADGAIGPDDPVPPRPGLAMWVTEMRGCGRGQVKVRSLPVVLVTHHAFSRSAQRWGARTVDDLSRVCTTLLEACIALVRQRPEPCPPAGWRLACPLGTVVFRFDDQHCCFVAVTVLSTVNGGPDDTDEAP
jgi:hypothetical protein